MTTTPRYGPWASRRSPWSTGLSRSRRYGDSGLTPAWARSPRHGSTGRASVRAGKRSDSRVSDGADPPTVDHTSKTRYRCALCSPRGG